MSSTDLTIPLDGLDTNTLLQEWRWVVPSELRPLHLSKFGDWFLTATDGSVHLLDLIEGELRQIAPSMQQFETLKDLEDNQAEWYQDAFVAQCDAEGMVLGPGECFGWRVHPMKGGEFTFENIQKFPLEVYQRQVGALLRQERGKER